MTVFPEHDGAVGRSPVMAENDITPQGLALHAQQVEAAAEVLLDEAPPTWAEDSLDPWVASPMSDNPTARSLASKFMMGHQAPPIHEVLLDEESPASELMRAHIQSLSDEDLAASWYKLELQSRQLAEDPGSSDWVKAGWDPDHAATMIGCSFRATDREMARRESLKSPQSGAVGKDSP